MLASRHRSDNRDGAIHVVPEADDIIVLSLEGEFDLRSASALGEELDRVLAHETDVILDLSQATFIDSSVIHVLFRTAQATKESGRTAVLQLATAPLIERAIEIVGMERMLPRAQQRQEAIEIIQHGRQ
jgi:anti-anti-sigma factor